MKNAPDNEEYERCIMCGMLTGIPVSMPVEWREDYMIGCGQVCIFCKQKLCKEAIKENTLSHDQILIAVEKAREESKK